MAGISPPALSPHLRGGVCGSLRRGGGPGLCACLSARLGTGLGTGLRAGGLGSTLSGGLSLGGRGAGGGGASALGRTTTATAGGLSAGRASGGRVATGTTLAGASGGGLARGLRRRVPAAGCERARGRWVNTEARASSMRSRQWAHTAGPPVALTGQSTQAVQRSGANGKPARSPPKPPT
jgi:hypothetical protein